MKLIEALRKMALNAGFKADNAELAKVIGLPALADIEIDDTVATPMLQLMGMEAAKANADLASHFKATTLAGVDAQFKREAEKAGYSAEQIAEWMKPENTSTKRIELLVDKMRADAAEAIRKGGNKTEETQKLNDQINTLQASMADKQKEFEGKLTEQQQAHQTEITNWQIKQLIGAFPRNPAIDASVFDAAALNILNAQLPKDAKIISKDGQVHLVQAANEGADYYNGATKVVLQDVAKEILMKAGLVAATPGSKPQTGESVKVDASAAPSYGGGYSAQNEINSILEASQAALNK